MIEPLKAQQADDGPLVHDDPTLTRCWVTAVSEMQAMRTEPRWQDWDDAKFEVDQLDSERGEGEDRIWHIWEIWEISHEEADAEAVPTEEVVTPITLDEVIRNTREQPGWKVEVVEFHARRLRSLLTKRTTHEERNDIIESAIAYMEKL